MVSTSMSRKPAFSVRLEFGVILGLMATATLPLLGCGGASSAIPDRIDAQQASKMALEEYDENGDGLIKGKELDKSLALKDALGRIDSNNDKAISAEELASRLDAYKTHSAFVAGGLELKLGPNPVKEATVVLEPEAFMGDSFQTYKGKSDDAGNVNLIGQRVDTPGLPVGLYKMTVTRAGGETYNFGLEVADDSPSASRLVLSL